MIGLDADEAMTRLDNNKLREAVSKQEAHWVSMGITGVPTVIFNRTSALTGAHSVEAY